MTAFLIISAIVICLMAYFISTKQKNRDKKLLKLQQRWGRKREGLTNFELINLYQKFVQKTDFTLNGQTLNDLDIGEVFKSVDHTYSRVGQQFLFAHLTKGNASKEWLNELETTIKQLESNPDLRTKIIQTLDVLNETSDYYFPLLFQDAPIRQIKRFWLIQLLQTATLSSFVLLFFVPYFFFPFLVSITLSIGVHYWNKWQVEKYQHILKRFCKFFFVANEISEIQQREKFFNVKDRKQEIQNLKRVNSRLGLISVGGRQSDDMQQIGVMLIDFLNAITLLEVSAFNKFFSSLPAFRDDFFSLFELIGSVDVVISVISWRSSLPRYSTPIFTPEKKGIFIENAVHPLVEDCIPNSLELENNSMILTGSNMAGKTTFIRTVGLNVLFAQMLNTVLATTYEGPILKIASAIRFKDDVLDGQSYYLTEVAAIKTMLETSEQEAPVLFIIDELFKGTNTIERIAAASGVLTYLNRNNHLVLVSTHDIELTELLNKERFERYFFQESVVDNHHVFTYKLQKGVMQERNALRLLEVYDYPKEVIRKASETVEVLEGRK